MSNFSEALESQDPDVIFNARTQAKRFLTIHCKSYRKTIQGIDLEEIDEELAEGLVEKVEKAFNLTEELHTLYMTKRKEGEDEETERDLADKDDKWYEEVTDTYFESRKIKKLYENEKKIAKEKEVMSTEKNKKINLLNSLKTKQQEAKLTLETVLTIATEVSISIEEKTKRTAQQVDEDLKITLARYSDATLGYKEVLAIKEDAAKMKEIDEENKSTQDTAKQLQNELRKIIEEFKVLEKEQENNRREARKTDRSVETSYVKTQKIKPPEFDGQPRNWANFLKIFEKVIISGNRPDVEIGHALIEAIPERHKHLIDNKDLDDHKGMMEVLKNKFGEKHLTVSSVVSDIERLKTPETDKQLIAFVETLERAKRDLEALGQLGELANQTVISKIEQKLTGLIRRDWNVKFVQEKIGRKTSDEVFAAFLQFLVEQKETAEYSMCENRNPNGKNVSQANVVVGCFTGSSTREDPAKRFPKEREWKRDCLACQDGATNAESAKHPEARCEVWRALSMNQKKAKLKDGCMKCMSLNHKTNEHVNRGSESFKCRKCDSPDHCQYMCERYYAKANTGKSTVRSSTLSVRSVVLDPAILMTSYVKGKGKTKYGALYDRGSTDSYITIKKAKELGLEGVPAELIVEGIGGQVSVVDTKLYDVLLVDKYGKHRKLEAFGLEKVCSILESIPKDAFLDLCDKFGVNPSEVARPEEIDLLIGLRDPNLQPNKVKIIGKVELSEGVFGKVFGGSDKALGDRSELHYPRGYHAMSAVGVIKAVALSAAAAFDDKESASVDRYVDILPDFRIKSEENQNVTTDCKILKKTVTLSVPEVTILREVTRTHVASADKEFLDYFREESIGVKCSPACGGCACGKCPLGSKAMTLKDEKEYLKLRENMEFLPNGTPEDPTPHWQIKYPWIIPKQLLPDNRLAVEGVLKSNQRVLNRNPTWKSVYEQQIVDLVDLTFAREVSKEEKREWIKNGGKVYYIAHLAAPNPKSKTTPVRICFNASQSYKGHSLNQSWASGPNMLNSMNSIMLRWREALEAGIGDIRKLYYMLRLPVEEQMMQLFLYQWEGEVEPRVYCMCRLIMGSKPAANYAIIALKETVDFESNQEKHPRAVEVVQEDSYMDDLFACDDSREELQKTINDVNAAVEKGGFVCKEWKISHDDVENVEINVKLPNQIGEDEEKALGVGWDVKKDELYVPGVVNFSTRKGKVHQGPDLQFHQITDKTVPNLTLRVCLQQIAKSFDPNGYILPFKMIGTLLFRNTLLYLKKDVKGGIPWDKIIPVELRKPWIDYFKEVPKLSEVKFRRSVKPENVNPDLDPVLVTFSDGSTESYGGCAYVLWDLMDGTREAVLIAAKGKLGPLTHRGETVKMELNGATLTTRLKSWIQKESKLIFREHIPFLDAKIVQAMIQRSSYGYNTFAALRVGEIQQNSEATSHLWIPSKENISDIITRGASPAELGPDSTWQKGPSWLVKERSEWPCETPMITKEMEDEITKLSRKVIVTKVANVSQVTEGIAKMIKNCSSFPKCVRVFAFVLRVTVGRVAYARDKLAVQSKAQEMEKLPSKVDRSAKVLKKTECVKTKSGQEQVVIVRAERGSDMEKLFEIVPAVDAIEYQRALAALIQWDQENYLDVKKCARLNPISVRIDIAEANISFTHHIVGGRIKNFPASFNNGTNVTILSASPLARIIALHFHNKYHKEVDTIVAIIREQFWIIGCRKIVSSIDYNCAVCRKNRKNRAGQQMGKLPEFRTVPTKAWDATALDLFGPMKVKQEKSRGGAKSTFKVWGMVFTCLQTRAVHCDVSVGYSTEEILHPMRRFLAGKGQVSTLVSDPGTQLCAADAELKAWREGWNEKELKQFGAEKGITWIFVMPDGQHQNGAVEAKIKGIKKSLKIAIGEALLTLNELNTVLAEVANLANEVPMGLLPDAQSSSEYLCPNNLLLGVCSSRIGGGPFSEKRLYDENDAPKEFKKRFFMVQRIIDNYWRIWQKLYFPTLVVMQKWHTAKRNLAVGDVVMIEDSNTLRGQWRLGRVAEVYPDSEGLVRNVSVLVKTDGPEADYDGSKATYIKRHANKVVVLVPVTEENLEKEIVAKRDNQLEERMETHTDGDSGQWTAWRTVGQKSFMASRKWTRLRKSS